MKFFAVLLGLSLAAPLAAAPIRLTGHVFTGKSSLSGARVELFPAYEGYADAVRRLKEKKELAPIAKAFTDAAGGFEILAPESGCYRVAVRAEGYLAQEIAFLPLVEDVELPAAALVEGTPVEVRTVGPDGQPLAGIEVQPFGSPPLQPVDRLNWELASPRVTTDSAGRGSFSWLQPYGLTPPMMAVSPRFLGQGAQARPGEAATLRLVPARPGWIEARDAGGQLVPGALARWIGRPVGITGPDGRLEIAVPEQASVLTLENGEGLGTPVFRTVKEDVQPVRLKPLRRIAGQVVDAVSRQPVAGALVWSGPPLVAPAVRSGEDGKFVLTVPAGAEVQLNAGAAGFLSGESQTAGQGMAKPVLLKLAPSAALSGTVVDRSGQPVADARIDLISASWREGGTRVYAGARSRADGGFRFSQLPPDESFELSAVHSSFARAAAQARTAPAGQPSPSVRIVMASGQTAFGRVVDEEDRPVAGAGLTLTLHDKRSGVGERFEAVSDETGRFALRHLPPGSRGSLRAAHPGYAAASLAGIEIPSEGPDVDLGSVRMPPAVAIEGRVTDSRARPIAGAEVFVEPDGMSFPGESGWLDGIGEPLRTGTDGSFRAGGLERGRRYDLTVSREGYSPASLPAVEAPTAEPLRIEMKTARFLSGQVVGPAGEPVAGASLSLIQELRTGMSWSSGTQSLGTTDEAGRFRVSVPPPGSIILGVTAEGYAPRRIEGLEIPEDRDLVDLRVTLSRGGVLDVRVLNPEGEPVAGAWVRASPAGGADRPDPRSLGREMGWTDSTGRYRLVVPEVGVYRVEAGVSTSTTATTVQVTAGPEATPVELRFSSGAEVSGRVVGEDGTGIAAAMVRLVEESGKIHLGGGTGPDGTFVFSLVDDGTYRLEASWQGLAADARELTVAGNPVRGLELRVNRPEEGRARLTVRLLGLTLEEIPRVRITAFEMGSPALYGQPDRAGLCRFEHLQPGEWTVQAAMDDGRQAQGTVQVPPGAGDTVLDLELRKGLTLTGRVLVDGKPLSGGSLESRQGEGSSSTRTSYDGTFTLRGLAAGPVMLVLVSDQGFLGTYTVDVTEDQEVSISLATGRLAGQVLTVTGEPVEEATLSLDAWIPALGTTISAPSARTRPDGAFEIPRLGAGTYKIKVHKEGFAPAEATAEVPAGGSSAPVAVVLKPQEGAP